MELEMGEPQAQQPLEKAHAGMDLAQEAPMGLHAHRELAGQQGPRDSGQGPMEVPMTTQEDALERIRAGKRARSSSQPPGRPPDGPTEGQAEATRTPSPARTVRRRRAFRYPEGR